MSSSKTDQQLHIAFFPFLAHGHMNPILDMATVFAGRNVKTTIITTHANAPTFTRAIESSDKNTTKSLINVEAFKFPAAEVGLPEGYENAALVMRDSDMVVRFYRGTEMLQEQLVQFLDRVRPDCLVADWSFPWATQCAARFNIPRLVFHSWGYFPMCVQEIVRLHEPWKNCATDESFVLPLIPHEVKLFRTEINAELMDKDHPMNKRTENFKKSEMESYGVIVNTFYELEPEYVDFFKNKLGRRAWHVGPVNLSNDTVEEKTHRGKPSTIDKHQCLTWLDSQGPASVIYVSFGSMVPWVAPQLHEIALALERSGKPFIWVVRSTENEDEWLPSGFETRTQGKGLIIRGWAPQILILEHKSVGAFLTHCGWNSTMEAICAGVPLVTWPVFAEQFYNEKLLTRILKIGVPVGAKKWSRMPSVDDVIGRESIEKAIREIMDGQEAEERRLRSRKLKDLARNALQPSGSSYADITLLIDELKNLRTQNSS